MHGRGAFQSHPKAAGYSSIDLPRPCISSPNTVAITWQEHVHRGVTLGLCQAPALAAAAVLQHVLHRGRAAPWNQPRARPLSLRAGVGRGLSCQEGPPSPTDVSVLLLRLARVTVPKGHLFTCAHHSSLTPSLSPLGAD